MNIPVVLTLADYCSSARAHVDRWNQSLQRTRARSRLFNVPKSAAGLRHPRQLPISLVRFGAKVSTAVLVIGNPVA
jgi:hypothetical protein